MTLEELKSLLEEKITEKLPTHTVVFNEVEKNNSVKRPILTLRLKANTDNSGLYKVFYLDDMLTNLNNFGCSDSNINNLVNYIIREVTENTNIPCAKDIINKLYDSEYLSSHLKVSVINEDYNINLPTRHIVGDIGVSLIVEDEIGTITLSKAHIESISQKTKLTLDKLFEIAMVNTNKEHFIAKSMFEVAPKLFTGENVMGDSSLDTNDFSSVTDELGGMFVVSNKPVHRGASVLVNEEALNDLHRILGDFLIIPSSIHEIIVVRDSASLLSYNTLKEMIKDVNNTELKEFERLSYNLFRYNGKNLEVVE